MQLTTRRVLTLLSIITTLKRLEADGRLIRYQPTVSPRSNSIRTRTIWLSTKASAWCCPFGASEDIRISDEALAQLQDILNAFVLGRALVYGTDMKILEPMDDEVWEFRSYARKPYLRLFGSFALPSHFIAVNHRVRDDLERRTGPQWDRAIRETIEARCALLNGLLPFQARPWSFAAYIR